jgi:hypothetical protein
MSVVINGSAGVTTNSGAVYNGIQSATSQASTSGTSITFSSIPSWVKRITVMLNGVSTNGSSLIQMQIGSGGVTTSGYTSVTVRVGANGGYTNASSGFLLVTGMGASDICSGTMIISNQTGNTWTTFGMINQNNTNNNVNQGLVSLGGTLDRVVITTVNGTDTFDAGSINILYE